MLCSEQEFNFQLFRTFQRQVLTPRYENWQGDCWAGDKPPGMDNDFAFQEPDLVNPLINL